MRRGRARVAQELGSAENMFLPLEGHRVVGHADSGLGVGVDNTSDGDENVEIREELTHEDDVASARPTWRRRTPR